VRCHNTLPNGQFLVWKNGSKISDLISGLDRDEDLDLGVGIDDVEIGELVSDPFSALVRIGRAGESIRQTEFTFVQFVSGLEKRNCFLAELDVQFVKNSSALIKPVDILLKHQ